jgi:EmrB/QacA subfamily drug resistance transporter
VSEDRALPNAMWVAILVAAAFFMENLDGTVIATAIPQISRSFHTSPVGLNVGITAYLLSLAMFIPISGWVADRIGARTVFAAAIAIFTLSSVLCGFCSSLPEFIGARILQGTGGAMMVPVGRLVVFRSTAKRDLVRAIAYVTWPGLAAPVIGPPLGGFITTYWSWRWIFFLNVPLGITAILFTFKLIPNLKEELTKRFDWLGFFSSGISCVLLMYGLDLIGRPQSSWPFCFGLILSSLVLGTFAAWHFGHSPHPLISLKALSVRTFAITIWGASLFRIAIGATPFLLPLMFQIGFGLTPFKSGTLILAVFAGNLMMKPATTPILKLFGFKRTLLGNGVITAICLLACCTLSPSTPEWIIVTVLFFGGLSRSMQFTSLNAVGFADIPPEDMSGASTLSSTIQTVTFAMGVAFGAISLRFASFLHGRSPASLDYVDFRIAFAMVGLIALASIFDCFGLREDAGREVSRHKIAPASGQARS